jgi:hypothetical protein
MRQVSSDIHSIELGQFVAAGGKDWIFVTSDCRLKLG